VVNHPNPGELPAEVRELLDVAPGELNALGFYAMRRIATGPMLGHWFALEPMTFGRVRLGISALKSSAEGEGEAFLAYAQAAIGMGFLDVWEFPDMATARTAYDTWDGAWRVEAGSEPDGWTRHPLTSRRRDPTTGQVRMRRTEIPDALIAQLRQEIDKGATHECDEWRVEFVDRCALCDRALPPEPAAVSLEDVNARRVAISGTDVARFIVRGQAMQQAVDEAARQALAAAGGEIREATEAEQLEALAKAARERGLKLSDDNGGDDDGR
jgi:hypothetical protein